MRAHVLFQDETEQLERRRKELISQIMNFWRENAIDYRTLPLKYQFLLSERRVGNLRLQYNGKLYNMCCIKPSVLREYPEIPFLRILHEEVAYASVENKTLDELKRRLDWLNDLTANYTYNTLKAWIADANYILNLKVRIDAMRKSSAAKRIN